MAACGFHPIVAVDFNDKMCTLDQRQCAIDTIVGDVTDVDTACKIWYYAKGAGSMTGGFSCQPFSRLGDHFRGLDKSSVFAGNFGNSILYPGADSGLGMRFASCTQFFCQE